MSQKAIVVVSDLHCGSVYGMMPPNFVSSDDCPRPQNKGQTYIWKCWEHLCKTVSKYPVAAVIANGDVVDGCQNKSQGTELSLPMLADQATAAEECLKYLQKHTGKAAWYFTQGTEYHVGRAAREEEIVARSLGAVPYNGLGTGRYCREVLDLNISGVMLNIAHHVGVASGMYRATAIDRESLFGTLAAREGRCNQSDCIVRSHVHTFVHTEYRHKHAVTTPCWQLQTRYMRHRSVYRMIPDIGAIVLWVDSDAKKNGEDPIRLQKILYDLPSMPITKLGE